MIDRHTFTFSIALAALALPLDGAAAAQVPSFAEVTGHEFGGRITSHSEMVRYVERLSEASPRVHVVELGRSWEGRKFVLAIVTSPDNHARLDEIRTAAQRLADPRATTGDEASQIIAGQPVIVWLGGSIHGFELSGSEGLLKLLEHLSLR
ncbi:MAG: M14 family zinc carboxypeptidase, partial [Gemmatimonadota bacterium]